LISAGYAPLSCRGELPLRTSRRGAPRLRYELPGRMVPGKPSAGRRRPSRDKDDINCPKPNRPKRANPSPRTALGSKSGSLLRLPSGPGVEVPRIGGRRLRVGLGSLWRCGRRRILRFCGFPASRFLRLFGGSGRSGGARVDSRARRRCRRRRALRRRRRRGGYGSRSDRQRCGSWFGCDRRRRCGRGRRRGCGGYVRMGRCRVRPRVNRNELAGAPCMGCLQNGGVFQEQIRVAAGTADARSHGQLAPGAQRQGPGPQTSRFELIRPYEVARTAIAAHRGHDCSSTVRADETANTLPHARRQDPSDTKRPSRVGPVLRDRWIPHPYAGSRFVSMAPPPRSWQ
jgi:hypothetical protein